MTGEQGRYGVTMKTKLSYEKALERTVDALKEQGFGVITEIDVKITMKEKLDLETRPYKILGACNPTLAHQALTADPDIGLLLPCNVIVRDEDDGATVGFVDPSMMAELSPSPELGQVAREARERLEKTLEAVAAIDT